jgi:Tfp pilus assembly protein PilF
MVELRDAAEKALLALRYLDPKDVAAAATAIRKALIRTPDHYEQCADRIFNLEAELHQAHYALDIANEDIELLEEKLFRLQARHKKLLAKVRGLKGPDE